jgi:hypothetical protein
LFNSLLNCLILFFKKKDTNISVKFEKKITCSACTNIPSLLLSQILLSPWTGPYKPSLQHFHFEFLFFFILNFQRNWLDWLDDLMLTLSYKTSTLNIFKNNLPLNHQSIIIKLMYDLFCTNTHITCMYQWM